MLKKLPFADYNKQIFSKMKQKRNFQKTVESRDMNIAKWKY